MRGPLAPLLLCGVIASIPFLPVVTAQDAGIRFTAEASGDEASCDLAVAPGANGRDVLDAAVETRCITSWTYCTFSFGVVVTSIDGRYDTPAHADKENGDACGELGNSYWAFYVNGDYATVGIDDYEAADGDEFTFRYETADAAGGTGGEAAGDGVQEATTPAPGVAAALVLAAAAGAALRRRGRR